MKKLRIALIVFFCITLVGFGAYELLELRHSDSVPPEITADEELLKESVSATDEQLLKGIQATDNRDGDVSDSLMVVSRSKFINDEHTVKVHYVAFDSNNNVGTYVRRVQFTDYVSPKIYVKSPLRFLRGDSSQNYLEDVTAEDCLEGDISGQLRMVSEEVDSKTGETIQYITISITNSFGDTSELRTALHLQDADAYETPAPALSDYVVYTNVGEEIKLKELVIGIWARGQKVSFSGSSIYSQQDVEIDDEGVDYSTPGVYHVTYSLMSPTSKNETIGTTDLIVIVEG